MLLAAHHGINALSLAFLNLYRSEALDKRRSGEIQKERQEVRGSMLQKQGLKLEERRVSIAAFAEHQAAA